MFSPATFNTFNAHVTISLLELYIPCISSWALIEKDDKCLLRPPAERVRLVVRSLGSMLNYRTQQGKPHQTLFILPAKKKVLALKR